MGLPSIRSPALSTASLHHAVAAPRIPLGLRVRSLWAASVLAITGVRPTSRSARRLAISTAPAALTGDAAAGDQVIARGRDRLASESTEASQRMRTHDAARTRVAELQSTLPLLGQQLEESANQLARLEAACPRDATLEKPGIALRLLVVVALLAEGWLTYGALGFLADNPIALLLSSCVAAPVAAALLGHAGVLIRRSFWYGRLAPTDAVAILLGIALPTIFGIGITLSRVVDVTTGRTAALWVSAGVQAIVLALPLVAAYRHADPQPHLSDARRLRDRAVTAHSRALSQLRELELAALARDDAQQARRESVLATYDHTLSVELARLGRSTTINAPPRNTQDWSGRAPQTQRIVGSSI